jgi:hypothetical protein
MKTMKDFIERAKEIHKEHIDNNDEINSDKGENWRCEVSLANGYLHGKELLAKLLRQEAIKCVKSLRELSRDEYNDLNDRLAYFSKIEWIELFFNITEDDLNED